MNQLNAMPKHNPKGMSLIEIMVAMTIFAVVLTGILPLSIFVISYARENTHIMQARTVMANMVEQLRLLPPSAAWRTNDASNADLNDNTTGDANTTVGSYGLRWNIADVDSSTQNVRLFVNWQSNNTRRTVSSTFTLIKK